MKIQPIIRDVPNQGHDLIVSVEGLRFYYERAEPVLERINLEMRKGWCVGIFGNNATGKSTLARLMSNKLQPVSGEIKYPMAAIDGSQAAPTSAFPRTAAAIVVSVVASAVVLAIGAEKTKKLANILLWWHWLALIGIAAAIMLAVKLTVQAVDRRQKAAALNPKVLHVTSETTDKEQIPLSKTIAAAIGEGLPKHLNSKQRQERVVAMLSAAGFQMYNQTTGEPVGNPKEYVRDGLKYGSLSGGQKHLIYILMCLARCPDVILCDEVLGGLDAIRQPRVLHMLKRMKNEAHMSLLYITTELHQLRVIADSIGFISAGQICELGTADDILDCPRYPATKDYVCTYRALPGCQVIGGKLAQSYNEVKGDEALNAPWLPTL